MYMEQMRGDASKHFGVLKLFSILRDVELSLHSDTCLHKLLNIHSYIYNIILVIRLPLDFETRGLWACPVRQ